MELPGIQRQTHHNFTARCKRGLASLGLPGLSGFIAELRTAGLPVSLTENLDAMEAVKHIPIEDREAFKYALAATLVKNASHWRVFETVFEVYFSLRGSQYRIGDEDETVTGRQTYQIGYTVRGALNELEGHGELYWNVTGNGWVFPIDVVEARIRLPAAAKFGQDR